MAAHHPSAASDAAATVLSFEAFSGGGQMLPLNVSHLPVTPDL